MFDPASRVNDRVDAVERMNTALAHRGPDNAAHWLDDDAGIVLGHRRLSIQDTSELGHQPMFSPSGRYVVVFNGEIYNFKELRGPLEAAGHTFRGHSDTAVLLASLDASDTVAEAVESWAGMFAFAVWDRQERSLSLVRDRLGKKPLYVFADTRLIIFASEMKALYATGVLDKRIDPDARAAYFRLGFVPAPLSITAGVRKIMPGCVQTIRFVDGGIKRTDKSYWSAVDAAAASGARRFTDEREAKDSLRSIVEEATRQRMIADVPLGAFLSGGIDSSLVVGTMAALSSQPVKTYTIQFDQDRFDESRHAAAVAKHLGTDHTTIPVLSSDALDIVPSLPTIYDEPFGDSSGIPTSVLCRVTRRHVTVALSGDGGDEAFLGYSRYPFALALWQRIRRLPLPLRRLAAATIQKLPMAVLGAVAKPLDRFVPDFGRNPLPIKLRSGARLLAQSTMRELYVATLLKHTDGLAVAGSSTQDRAWLASQAQLGDVFADDAEAMGFIDTQVYLPDDVLVKVDRASMASSLEVRSPLLDHRVFEAAWRVPRNQKLDGGKGKRILYELATELVPAEILDRPKMGFGVPLADWLRGPLSDWADDLLYSSAAMDSATTDFARVRTMWADHKSGKADWHAHIWLALVYLDWCRAYGFADA